MTPKYYHTPLKPVSTRARCPVCREAVYSLAGIHPQCAVKQADPPRPKTKPVVVPLEELPVGIILPIGSDVALKSPVVVTLG